MKRHDSMRGWFAYELYQRMQEDKDIWVVVGDLGYKMFDAIRDDFPERFINTGAAETAMIDIAVGLALSGKIPVVYSITTFLLYRPFESLRNYLHHEKIPVKLIGANRDYDYKGYGISHYAHDVPEILHRLHEIRIFYPKTKEEIPELLDRVLYNKKPTFLSLTR